VRASISDLQFQRSAAGEGRLILQLTDPKVDVNVFSESGDVKVEFLDTDIPERLLRRYDVTDFATPVSSVDVNTSASAAPSLTLEDHRRFRLPRLPDRQRVRGQHQAAEQGRG
jgi:type IV pilus assembly protein PilQ